MSVLLQGPRLISFASCAFVAKLAISIARKLNALIFLVPEGEFNDATKGS